MIFPYENDKIRSWTFVPGNRVVLGVQLRPVSVRCSFGAADLFSSRPYRHRVGFGHVAQRPLCA